MMPHPSVVKEKVELSVADATKMPAYAARPDRAQRDQTGAQPGLLVFQEAFGVNHHIRSVADRFAAEGYVAIAPEVFHRTAPPGFEADYTDFPSVMPHLKAVTPEKAELDIRAARDWLRSRADVDANQISCVGFCLGGRLSFIANSIVPLRAAVSFYGGGISPALLDRASRQQAPLLLIWGGLDKHILPEQRKALADALSANQKKYVNVDFAAADHGFFCDERAAYEPRSARQAWALTLEFLRS
ncbi:MAG: dienelactone hydrolase family protein [Terriglobales bacterium]